MFVTVPGFAAPVEALFGLANTPFEGSAFRDACIQIGTYDASSSDNQIWRFRVGETVLIVGIGDDSTVDPAILSVCWWETYSLSDHPDYLSWEAERAEFDRMYSMELETVVEVLGSPNLIGQDDDEDAHRWAIWRGKFGLLILQQSAYDPQFGLDINYWLQPWKDKEPRPTTPFIDWLFRQSSKPSKM